MSNALRPAALALAAVLAACTAPAREDNPPGNGCIAGQSVACACSDGRSGAQTCTSGGTFGACSCEGTSTPDGGTTTTPDAGTPQTACEKMCAHVYEDCKKTFLNTQDEPISESGCVTLCNGGSFTAAMQACFTAAQCVDDQINRCFKPGEPLCPEDADCAGRTCGPDPICGASCGTCSATEACGTGGQCTAIHGWVVETYNSGAAEALTIAADRSGGVRTALLGRDGSLYDVELVNGSWKYTLIEKIGVETFNAAQVVAMQIDANNRPHLAYYDTTAGHLKYGSYNGSSWTIETADQTIGAGSYLSLALDSQGLPHIAYSGAGTSQQLKYTHKDAQGAWQDQVVDTDSYSGLYTAIAVDASDKPHIAYDLGYRMVRYAHFDGTAWQKADVSPQNESPKFVSLALDPQGNPHITYHASQTGVGALRHAQFALGSWSVETVALVGTSNGHNSLAISNDGTLHVAFMETTQSDLDYARKTPGGSWQIQSVDSTDNAGMDCQMVLSKTGMPWVLYSTNRVGQLTMLAHDVP